MKIRTISTGLALSVPLIAGAACSDNRPPYFTEQPTYSDPDLQTKPSYYTQEPVYNWSDTAKPAATDPNAK